MSQENPEKPPKRTLLQKYDIPVECLDFPYIKSCNDVKMIERIVKILRSGEEGWFPDLTRCAEDRLRELKPGSKMFRTESAILKKDCLDDDERKGIENDLNSFINDIKEQDKLLKDCQPKRSRSEPPIRSNNFKIDTAKESKDKRPVVNSNSTDYSKWDKYDADAEALKIELNEERQREAIDMKNKKNLEKSKLIEVIEEEVDELSDFEKNTLSLKFKERGNEAFKAKDYDEAIKEYTQSINIKKNAAALNNRALVYLKLKGFSQVICDTNECLKIEPNNVKALLRKAQAFVGQDMISQAYDTFEKIIRIDSTNETAQQEIIKLQNKMPPRKSFRMAIEEVEELADEPKELKQGKSEKLDMPETSHVPDLVKNIVPEEKTIFDKFTSETSKARENLIMPGDVHQKTNSIKKGGILIQEIN